MSEIGLPVRVMCGEGEAGKTPAEPRFLEGLRFGGSLALLSQTCGDWLF